MKMFKFRRMLSLLAAVLVTASLFATPALACSLENDCGHAHEAVTSVIPRGPLCIACGLGEGVAFTERKTVVEWCPKEGGGWHRMQVDYTYWRCNRCSENLGDISQTIVPGTFYCANNCMPSFGS